MWWLQTFLYFAVCSAIVLAVVSLGLIGDKQKKDRPPSTVRSFFENHGGYSVQHHRHGAQCKLCSKIFDASKAKADNLRKNILHECTNAEAQHRNAVLEEQIENHGDDGQIDVQGRPAKQSKGGGQATLTQTWRSSNISDE